MCLYEMDVYACGHFELGGIQVDCGANSSNDSVCSQKEFSEDLAYKSHKCKACDLFRNLPQSAHTPGSGVFPIVQRKYFRPKSTNSDPPDPGASLMMRDERLRNGIGKTVNSHNSSDLRTLLAKYDVLDNISGSDLYTMNNGFDSICAESSQRTLFESLAFLYSSNPRPWLAIRKMVRSLKAEVLHKLLSFLSDIQMCSDGVTGDSHSSPTLVASRQGLGGRDLFQCVRARKLVIDMLHSKTQSWVIEVFAKNQRSKLLGRSGKVLRDPPADLPNVILLSGEREPCLSLPDSPSRKRVSLKAILNRGGSPLEVASRHNVFPDHTRSVLFEDLYNDFQKIRHIMGPLNNPNIRGEHNFFCHLSMLKGPSKPFSGSVGLLLPVIHMFPQRKFLRHS